MSASFSVGSTERRREGRDTLTSATKGDAAAIAIMNWAGTKNPFIGIIIGSRGPFRLGCEIDIEQAEAVEALLIEMRAKGIVCPSRKNSPRCPAAINPTPENPS